MKLRVLKKRSKSNFSLYEKIIDLFLSFAFKASELDDSGVYKMRIENFLNRVKLKALLYQVPGRAEDHAAMIIEQVCIFISPVKFVVFRRLSVVHVMSLPGTCSCFLSRCPPKGPNLIKDKINIMYIRAWINFVYDFTTKVFFWTWRHLFQTVSTGG